VRFQTIGKSGRSNLSSQFQSAPNCVATDRGGILALAKRRQRQSERQMWGLALPRRCGSSTRMRCPPKSELKQNPNKTALVSGIVP
jgi:hypothetical protein